MATNIATATTFVVVSIVEVLMNKIELPISIPLNDWTIKREIIAGNKDDQIKLRSVSAPILEIICKMVHKTP